MQQVLGVTTTSWGDVGYLVDWCRLNRQNEVILGRWWLPGGFVMRCDRCATQPKLEWQGAVATLELCGDVF